MAVTLPRGRDFTIEDLERFPSDDGCRYELIEGSLHVTPPPQIPHQRAARNLSRILEDACPPELEVFGLPLSVVLGPATALEPDLLVIRADTDDLARVTSPPLLVVEVLSPSTRAYDLGTKRQVYEAAGVGAFWVVDTDVPWVHAWTWGDQPGEGQAEGEDVLRIAWPFPVEIRPSDLVKRR